MCSFVDWAKLSTVKIFRVLLRNKVEHWRKTVGDTLFLICHFVSFKVVSKPIALQSIDVYAVFRFLQWIFIRGGECVACEVEGVNFNFVFARVGLQH